MDPHLLRLLRRLVEGALVLLRHSIVGNLLYFSKEISPCLAINLLSLRITDILLIHLFGIRHALFLLIRVVGGGGGRLLEDLGAAGFPAGLRLVEVLGGAEDGYVGLGG